VVPSHFETYRNYLPLQSLRDHLPKASNPHIAGCIPWQIPQLLFVQLTSTALRCHPPLLLLIFIGCTKQIIWETSRLNLFPLRLSSQIFLPLRSKIIFLLILFNILLFLLILKLGLISKKAWNHSIDYINKEKCTKSENNIVIKLVFTHCIEKVFIWGNSFFTNYIADSVLIQATTSIFDFFTEWQPDYFAWKIAVVWNFIFKKQIEHKFSQIFVIGIGSNQFILNVNIRWFSVMLPFNIGVKAVRISWPVSPLSLLRSHFDKRLHYKYLWMA